MVDVGLFVGGYSEEREISLRSAQLILRHHDASRYRLHIIDVARDEWRTASGGTFDRNTGQVIEGEKRYTLSGALLIIHGSPAEDGLLQACFDLIQLPYSGSNPFVSGLTFDKYATKQFLAQANIPMAQSIRLIAPNSSLSDTDLSLRYPLFVKPNRHGSSFGISRVEQAEDLPAAIEKAFSFDDQIMVEEYIEGREISCGLIVHKGELVTLPLTEIKPYSAFFDYAAKYEHQSEELTPAPLSVELTGACQEQTKRIYQLLGCKGMARIDYILKDNTFYLLEVNTIPGLSETSIVPQQVIAAGISLSEFVSDLLLEAIGEQQG